MLEKKLLVVVVKSALSEYWTNGNFYAITSSTLVYRETVIDEMQKSPIEKRKRNLKTISPHSRGEREIRIPFHQFR